MNEDEVIRQGPAGVEADDAAGAQGVRSLGLPPFWFLWERPELL
ncbi:hypothetical protein ACFRIB_38550 [Streptomyces mirabilis]